MGGCSVIRATPVLYEYLSKSFYYAYIFCDNNKLYMSAILCYEMYKNLTLYILNYREVKVKFRFLIVYF